jgi:hypothetical protein
MAAEGELLTAGEAVMMGSLTVPMPSAEHYMVSQNKMPLMSNFYALNSAERPVSRIVTTIFFAIGFVMLAMPSALTFLKVGGLLIGQMVAGPT